MKSSVMTILQRLLCCGLLAAGLGAGAAGADESAFSLSGFGTLGAVRTSTDHAEFVRDLSQPRGATSSWTSAVDSVLGVQANWKMSREWEAVVQLNSRYRFDRSFRPDLAWAYLKYEPLPNVSLRAGHLGTEFFMLADSRWVGYSFLTVRPPGAFFWYLPFYSINGMDAALTVPLGESQIRGKVFWGKSQGKVPLAEEQWNIDGSPMMGGYVEYHHGPYWLRGSYANLKFTHDLPLNPVLAREAGMQLNASQLAYLATTGKRTHYASLGFVYDDGPWQGQIMLNMINQGSQAFENSLGGYAQLGYRVGNVTPYLGYSQVRSKGRENETGHPLVGYVMADSHTDQRTHFAGVRWDFARNLALKAQWDGIRGTASSILPYRREIRSQWDGRMDVFSLSLDFIF